MSAVGASGASSKCLIAELGNLLSELLVDLRGKTWKQEIRH